MTATIERTTTVAAVIATLRIRWQAERDAAKTCLGTRGIEVVGPVSRPPSDAELLADFWWYSGMLCALEDLIDELELDLGGSDDEYPAHLPARTASEGDTRQRMPVGQADGGAGARHPA